MSNDDSDAVDLSFSDETDMAPAVLPRFTEGEMDAELAAYERRIGDD